LRQYKAFDSGIPFWVVLDKNGKLLYDSFVKNVNGDLGIIGCPATEEEVNTFIKILNQSSLLSDKELKIIYAVFRKNEVN
jgi:coenzyme F420-reducing hydrogenase gamma subunit